MTSRDTQRPDDDDRSTQHGVLRALDLELDRMGPVGRSALAEAARRLAEQLDAPRCRAEVATEFRQTMTTLRDLAPVEPADSPKDELRRKREARRRRA